jgi:hypothetical protein
MKRTLTVEKVTAQDFEKTYPLLLDFENPKITKSQWERLFIDNWNFQPGYSGYKLVLGDRVVGFIAYTHSRKLINDNWENFCNISTWIVKPEYRSNSVDLLYPLLDLKDHTITAFTPTAGAYKVETKLFRLKILDCYEVIMPALPRLSALWGKKFKVFTHRKDSPDRFFQILLDNERKIFQDHLHFDCEHVVIALEEGHLYLIFKKIYKRHLPFAKLYYLNNQDTFLYFLEDIRFRGPLALKTAGIVVDSRFLQDRNVPFKKNKNFYMPMLFKSNHLQPHEVDYLYSEFFLLGA